MGKNLKQKLGTGLTPQQFMDGMTQNKDKFLDWFNRFEWKDCEDREFFRRLANDEGLRCLILASDWCGDVVRNIPVVFRALSESRIQVEVLIMEENQDVMDQFLTMGGRAIPIVIFANQHGDVLGQWGPRPAHVQSVMVQFKKENPDRNAADYQEKLRICYSEMMKQYGQGTAYQETIVKELRELLTNIIQ